MYFKFDATISGYNPASARSASCRSRLVDMQGDADGKQQSFKICERDCAAARHVTPAIKGICAAFCRSQRFCRASSTLQSGSQWRHRQGKVVERSFEGRRVTWRAARGWGREKWC